MLVSRQLRIHLVRIAFAGSMLVPGALMAQERTLKVWFVPQADPIGLHHGGQSSAMIGGAVLLLYHRPESQWTAGVSLGGMSQTARAHYGQFASSVGGVTVEARRALATGSIRPYVVGSVGAANIRVDMTQQYFEGFSVYGGSDATTGTLGAGLGAETKVAGVRVFADLQYNWRSNGIYGRGALPLRIGFHY